VVVEVVEANEIHADDVIVVSTSGHAQPDMPARVLAVLSTEHPLFRILLSDGRKLDHATAAYVCRLRESDAS
jgi:hypothetical protein